MKFETNHRTILATNLAYDPDRDTSVIVEPDKLPDIVMNMKVFNGNNNGDSKMDNSAKLPTRIKQRKSLSSSLSECPATCDSTQDLDSYVPNGGYGWLVVFAGFMCNFTVDGICYTFGLFLPYFMEEFHSNKSITSLAGSLMSGCYLTSGVFVSGLVNRFGCRPVAIAGSVLAAGSLVLSSIAPNVYVLNLTFGMMTGLSFGLIYLPSIVSVGYYFNTKRSFATGIVVCGSGTGAFIFSPISRLLLDNFGWKISVITLAGFVLLVSLYGALMKPLKRPDDKQNIIEKNDTVQFDGQTIVVPKTESIDSIDGAQTSSAYSSDSSNNAFDNSAYASDDISSNDKTRITECSSSSLASFEKCHPKAGSKSPLNDDSSSLRAIFQSLSVLKIPAMALLSISNIFGMTGYYIPFFFISNFSSTIKTSDGQLISAFYSSMLLSSIGFFNVVGRLWFGMLSDRYSGRMIFNGRIKISALLINNLCLLSAGIFTITIPFMAFSYWILLANTILFGFTIAPYMSLTSIILVDHLGLDRLSTTFGLISCFRGLSAIVGAPLAGWLYQITDSYTLPFVSAGLLIVISSLISFVVHRYEK